MKPFFYFDRLAQNQYALACGVVTDFAQGRFEIVVACIAFSIAVGFRTLNGEGEK